MNQHKCQHKKEMPPKDKYFHSFIHSESIHLFTVLLFTVGQEKTNTTAVTKLAALTNTLESIYFLITSQLGLTV